MAIASATSRAAKIRSTRASVVVRLSRAPTVAPACRAINDGSLLFLQHKISEMRPPEQGGNRLAIVFNGTPLFAGADRIG